MTIAAQRPSVPESIWKDSGITEHMGGVKATERLLRMADVAPGQLVADLGCGTGYTARVLAERGANVIALDIDRELLVKARARASKSGVAEKVNFIQADVHRLPFKEGTFDAALAESVLAFCDAGQAAREACRTLKPGGTLGINELTYLRTPDPALKAMLRLTLGLSPLNEAEWKAVFRKAGFTSVISIVSKIRLPGQFMSHLKIDGPIAYSRALVKGMLKPAISRAFFRPKMLGAMVKYRSYVGYGLYMGRKP